MREDHDVLLQSVYWFHVLFSPDMKYPRYSSMHHCQSKNKNCVQLARVSRWASSIFASCIRLSNCVISANSVSQVQLSTISPISTWGQEHPCNLLIAELQKLLQGLFWAFLPVRRFTQKVGEVSRSFHIIRFTVNGGVFIESFYLFPKTKGNGGGGKKMGNKGNTTD